MQGGGAVGGFGRGVGLKFLRGFGGLGAALGALSFAAAAGGGGAAEGDALAAEGVLGADHADGGHLSAAAGALAAGLSEADAGSGGEGIHHGLLHGGVEAGRGEVEEGAEALSGGIALGFAGTGEGGEAVGGALGGGGGGLGIGGEGFAVGAGLIGTHLEGVEGLGELPALFGEVGLGFLEAIGGFAEGLLDVVEFFLKVVLGFGEAAEAFLAFGGIGESAGGGEAVGEILLGFDELLEALGGFEHAHGFEGLFPLVADFAGVGGEALEGVGELGPGFAGPVPVGGIAVGGEVLRELLCGALLFLELLGGFFEPIAVRGFPVVELVEGGAVFEGPGEGGGVLAVAVEPGPGGLKFPGEVGIGLIGGLLFEGFELGEDAVFFVAQAVEHGEDFGDFFEPVFDAVLLAHEVVVFLAADDLEGAHGGIGGLGGMGMVVPGGGEVADAVAGAGPEALEVEGMDDFGAGGVLAVFGEGDGLDDVGIGRAEGDIDAADTDVVGGDDGEIDGPVFGNDGDGFGGGDVNFGGLIGEGLKGGGERNGGGFALGADEPGLKVVFDGGGPCDGGAGGGLGERGHGEGAGVGVARGVIPVEAGGVEGEVGIKEEGDLAAGESGEGGGGDARFAGGPSGVGRGGDAEPGSLELGLEGDGEGVAAAAAAGGVDIEAGRFGDAGEAEGKGGGGVIFGGGFAEHAEALGAFGKIGEDEFGEVGEAGAFDADADLGVLVGGDGFGSLLNGEG